MKAFDSDEDSEGDGEQEQEALGDLIDDSSIQHGSSITRSEGQKRGRDAVAYNLCKDVEEEYDEEGGKTRKKTKVVHVRKNDVEPSELEQAPNTDFQNKTVITECSKFEIIKPKVKGRYEELKKYLSENNPENVRVLTDVEFESVLSIEELGDVYYHLILHYENILPALSTDDDDLKNLRDQGNVDLKLYRDIADTGLGRFVKEHYGSIPMQLGENMSEKIQRNEVRQIAKLPRVAAFDYVSTAEIETKFSDYKDVLDAANYMVAAQIAGEPLVRRCARKSFLEDAYIHVKLTEQSLKEINGNQPSCKFLKQQPVRDLEEDQFLRLVVAEQAGVLTIVLQRKSEGATTSYLDHIKSLFTHNLFKQDDELVKNWDAERTKIIDLAFTKFLLPQLEKELRVKLLNAAKECVVRDVLYGKGERRQSKAEVDSEQPEHSSTVTTPSSSHRKRAR